MRGHALLVIGLATILAGAGLMVAALLIGGGPGRLGEPSCAIAVTGTAATVTLQGAGAEGRCTELLSRWGALAYPADTPVVCRYPWQGLKATVRDSGVLLVVGRALCASLSTQRLEPPNPPGLRA